MPIMSKEMAFQVQVEKTIAERYQGWRLVELCWEPATHHVRVMVRCPHGQTGAMWSLGLDMVPPVEVADMLLDELRARCEEDHQQMPKPPPVLLPHVMNPEIMLSADPSPFTYSSVVVELRKVFPGLAQMVEPPYGGPPDTVDRIIVNLNDGRWLVTRADRRLARHAPRTGAHRPTNLTRRLTMLALPEKVDELRATLPDLEKAMSYTLSDAIREGLTVTRQARGMWASPTGDLCALSAARLALEARRMI